MQVICRKCGREFDWDSPDIFMVPSSYGYGGLDFECRDDLKNSRAYKKGKMQLKR
jgi:hypothetical protein